MTIEMTCRTCGELFTPSREDIAAGPATYRRCEACRSGDELAGSVARENPGAVV